MVCRDDFSPCRIASNTRWYSCLFSSLLTRLPHDRRTTNYRTDSDLRRNIDKFVLPNIGLRASTGVQQKIEAKWRKCLCQAWTSLDASGPSPPGFAKPLQVVSPFEGSNPSVSATATRSASGLADYWRSTRKRVSVYYSLFETVADTGGGEPAGGPPVTVDRPS